MSNPDDDELIPDPKVAHEEFGVCLKTINRWERKPELSFPPAIWINGRKYRRRGEIREFKRRSAVAHASTTSAGTSAKTPAP